MERWDINLGELEELILKNPSLCGFLTGYLAEAKVREMLSKDKRVSALKKFDDHDRTNKHDLVITYKGYHLP